MDREGGRICPATPEKLALNLIMVLPPDWAGSCTAETFVAHYASVAAEIPVMVVTNVFGRSHELGLEVLRRLRDEVPGVVAIKDDLVGAFARKMATYCSTATGR